MIPRDKFLVRVPEAVDRLYEKHGKEKWSRPEFFSNLMR